MDSILIETRLRVRAKCELYSPRSQRHRTAVVGKHDMIRHHQLLSSHPPVHSTTRRCNTGVIWYGSTDTDVRNSVAAHCACDFMRHAMQLVISDRNEYSCPTLLPATDSTPKYRSVVLFPRSARLNDQCAMLPMTWSPSHKDWSFPWDR